MLLKTDVGEGGGKEEEGVLHRIEVFFVETKSFATFCIEHLGWADILKKWKGEWVNG